jgi:small subunit ribosomal protein S27e
MAAPFLKIRCPDCSAEQNVFSRAATEVKCQVCGTTLAKPTVGTAVFKGEILATLE